jgi:hypothetical protein
MYIPFANRLMNFTRLAKVLKSITDLSPDRPSLLLSQLPLPRQDKAKGKTILFFKVLPKVILRYTDYDFSSRVCRYCLAKMTVI